VVATICPRPVTLTFDLLTLKSVWESHVTWGTPVQSFVFLGLLVFELEPMYATSDGRTDDGRRSPLNAPPPPTGRGHNNDLSGNTGSAGLHRHRTAQVDLRQCLLHTMIIFSPVNIHIGVCCCGPAADLGAFLVRDMHVVIGRDYD